MPTMRSKTFHVLLIEDDAGDAIIVRRMLQGSRQEFSVRHCEYLEEALDCLANDEFDVALLDLSLPDSFGLSGLDRVREIAQDIPIVVLTGLADDDLALQSLEQGAQDYLVKGNASTESLERTLRHAVQRQQIQTENRHLLERMEALALQDPLTGVLNRHSFTDNLEREWQRAKRYGGELACVTLDLDFFKRINDTYGHAAGDETLKKVAGALCQNSRASDSVGRFGGEEFCVLLPETSEAQAIAWAERVRNAIAALAIATDHGELKITASLGVSSYSMDLVKVQLLIEQADAAMLVAKQLGRNQVVSFGRLRGLGQHEAHGIWHGVELKQLVTQLDDYLSPRQSMQDAAHALQASNADSIAVLSEQGELLGVLGQDDIMAATLTDGTLEASVGGLMQTQLVTFSSDTEAREVCEFFCRAAVRQVFVSDRDGALFVLRRADFVRWLSNAINNASESHAESLAAM